ncbi:MAG TPA: hypothetical protein PLA91_00315 [Bacillota bacterium]|nr:hypothetical protein [Bacillota bacterium]
MPWALSGRFTWVFGLETRPLIWNPGPKANRPEDHFPCPLPGRAGRSRGQV